MWVYDEFTGLFYYDELIATPGGGYSQTGNVVVALSGGGTQTAPGAYEQPLDVQLGIYSTTTQELLPPGTPQAYTQQGALVALLLGGAYQEHIPAFAGQDGQSGNVLVAVVPAGYQVHFGGGNPGDVVQTGSGTLVITLGAEQQYTAPELVRLVTKALGAIKAFGDVGVVPALFDFPPSQQPISRVQFDFSSSDAAFVAVLGPSGGTMYVELSLALAGRQPLVSLSAAAPRCELFAGQSAAFDAIRQAIQNGQLAVEVRAYEALPSRVIGRPLTAGTLTVEALP